MQTTNQCLECQQPFSLKRNPQQKFCHQSKCQNARKRSWRLNKRNQEPEQYKSSQRLSDQEWQSKNSQYWSFYRATHPEYVLKNRQQQKIRDQSRSQGTAKVNASLLAKSDVLLKESPIKSGIYYLIPSHDLLAKSDALLVKISLISIT